MLNKVEPLGLEGIGKTWL